MSETEQAILRGLPRHLRAWLLEAARDDAAAKGCPVSVVATLGEVLEHVRGEEGAEGRTPASSLVH